MGSDAAFTFGSKEVETGHIYNITRSASPLANATTEDVGKLIGADGKIYENAAAATEASTTAVAIITYVGSDAETSTTFNHGLALALTNAENSVSWCSQKSESCLDSWYKNKTDAMGDMAGIANTGALVAHTGHTHAASAARNYNGGTHPTGTSAWFLPSAGQWVKMVSTAGNYATLRTNADLQSANYWSSTEYGTGYDSSYAWYYCFTDGHPGLDNNEKDKGYAVRSALAF